MWEFKAWSSASIRTLPAVAMAPLPPCTLPIPKWDVQVFKQPPPGREKKKPHHNLSPPSVSLSTTIGADKMGE